MSYQSGKRSGGLGVSGRNDSEKEASDREWAKLLAKVKLDNILPTQQSLRAGWAGKEELERSKLVNGFKEVKAQIQLFVDRREAQERQLAELEAKQAERRWGQLAFERQELPKKEAEARRKLLVFEEHSFATIARLCQHHYSVVEVTENIRKLVRNENNKRYHIERAEERGYEKIAVQFGDTEGLVPTLKVLGSCPFRNKADCPFHKGSCYGLAVASSHKEGVPRDAMTQQVIAASNRDVEHMLKNKRRMQSSPSGGVAAVTNGEEGVVAAYNPLSPPSKRVGGPLRIRTSAGVEVEITKDDEEDPYPVDDGEASVSNLDVYSIRKL